MSQATGFKSYRVMRERANIVMVISLALMGLIFLYFALFIYKSHEVDPSWSRVEGEIETVVTTNNVRRNSTLYTPVIGYKVGNTSYKIDGRGHSTTYPKIGEKLEVAYNPSNPSESKVVENIKTNWGFYMFPTFGLLAIGIAASSYIRMVKKNNRMKLVRRSGQKLRGVIVEVQSVNDREEIGYRVIAAATDRSGMVRNYASETLNGVGGLARVDLSKNPIAIDIYVDPTDSENYYVDVINIPNLTSERIEELMNKAAKEQEPTPSDDDNTKNT